jgi:DNA-binding transcriptional LysR family regulator
VSRRYSLIITSFHKNSPIDLRRLTIFLAVVDEGSFTSAGDAVQISQPAVSQAIRELESALGATLFNRIGRSVRLTFAGESLLPTARQVLREVANAQLAISNIGDLTTGRLDLACLPTLAVAPMAPLVGSFRSTYPGVSIVLADPQDTAELLEFVRSGLSEVGISNAIATDDLTSVQVGDQDFCVVLPPGTVVDDPLPIEKLARLPLVAAPRGSSTRALLDDVLGQLGETASIVVETAQREAFLPLIAAGAGSALLPRPLAESARRLGCVVVDAIPTVRRNVSLIHRTAALTPAAQLFIELAIQQDVDGAVSSS